MKNQWRMILKSWGYHIVVRWKEIIKPLQIENLSINFGENKRINLLLWKSIENPWTGEFIQATVKETLLKIHHFARFSGDATPFFLTPLGGVEVTQNSPRRSNINSNLYQWSPKRNTFMNIIEGIEKCE